MHGQIDDSVDFPSCGHYNGARSNNVLTDQLISGTVDSGNSQAYRSSWHLKALQPAAVCNPHHLCQVPHPDSIIHGQMHDGKGAGERAEDQMCRRCRSQPAMNMCMLTQQVGSQVIAVAL